MPKLRPLLAITTLLLLTPSPVRAEEGEGATTTQDLLVQIGGADYRRYCASCHGIAGTGDGPAAAGLSTKPPDLSRIAARRGGAFPAREIAAYIDGRSDVAAHGSREMPVWGRVFAEKIHDGATEEEVVRGRLLVLVEYLRSIQRRE